MQRQRGGGGAPRPLNALVHEGGADAASPRRRRDGEQSHLRAREGQGSDAGDLDRGARGVEEDGADHAITVERDDLGAEGRGREGREDVLAIGRPVRGDGRGVLQIGGEGDGLDGVAVTGRRAANRQGAHASRQSRVSARTRSMSSSWSRVASRWPRTTGRPCTQTSVTAWGDMA